MSEAEREISIGGRRVGPNQPAYVVAEIGINHNGQPRLLLEMVHAAAECGVDAVKVQSYRTDDFVVDPRLELAYTSAGLRVCERQVDLFRRCELDDALLCEVRAACGRRGIGFHSTPTSTVGVARLVELGVDVLKNGSDYLTHLPLIEAMGATGLPTVLSCGMATVGEIDDAVRTFRATGNDQLILLHCTSAYPTPAHAVHLRKLPRLASTFDCLAGFSDHSEGSAAAIGAAALGACWIEKHFTLDRRLPGPDQAFSASPTEMRELVDAVRQVRAALGSARLGFDPAEEAGRRDFRLSCSYATALPAGHEIAKGDLTLRRPGDGCPPSAMPWLIGRRLIRGVERAELTRLEDFE